MTFLVMAPGVEIITLTRDKKLTRKEEVDYLNEHYPDITLGELRYTHIQEFLKRLDCRIHTSCRMAEMAERIRSDERDLSQRRQDQVVSFMIGQNSCNGHDPFHGKCTAGKRGIHPKWRKEFIIKDEIQRPPGDGFDDTADDAVTQVGIPEGISRKAAARPADHFRDRPA